MGKLTNHAKSPLKSVIKPETDTQVFHFFHFQLDSSFHLLISNMFNDMIMAFVDKGFNLTITV